MGSGANVFGTAWNVPSLASLLLLTEEQILNYCKVSQGGDNFILYLKFYFSHLLK